MKLTGSLLFSIAAALQIQAAEFSTFIGPEPQYVIRRMIVDQSGNTYLAGGGIDFHGAGGGIAHSILKLDPTGALIQRIDVKHYIADLAIDEAGYIYVTGSGACDFPNHKRLEPWDISGAYMLKLDPRTGLVIYSTCFLGSLNAIAVDRSGRIWLTGTVNANDAVFYRDGNSSCGDRYSSCADLIVLPPTADRYLFHATWSGDPDPNCQPPSSSTCQLRPRHATGTKIAIDAAGDAYFMYRTAGRSWIIKLRGSDFRRIRGLEGGEDMAPDRSGNLFVAGSSSSGLVTTAGSYQQTSAGGTDAFARKYGVDGTLLWSTYIGGQGNETVSAVSLDTSGNVWIGGGTTSRDFPDALGRLSGEDFVVGFNSSGSALTYSGRFPRGVAGKLLAIDGQGIVRTTGSGGVVHAFFPSQMERRLFGLGNAAFGPATGLAAAGEVVSLYGVGIGPTVNAAAEAGAAALPKSLGGVQLFFDEFPAPLLYVSDSQINAVVPFGIAGRRRARVRIVLDGTSLREFEVGVIEALPEIFRLPDGRAAAVNEDGTLNSVSNPAKAGSVVSVWVSGGEAPPGASDGDVAREAKAQACIEASDEYEIRYSGAAPGMVQGVCQVNLVPRQISGAITVKARGWVSSSVFVFIRP